MKKSLALAVVTAFVLALPAMASQTKPAEKTERVRGTVTAWDDAGKTFKLKNKDDKVLEFSMNDQTKITGTPKPGDFVRVQYTKDKDGKAWATLVAVGRPTMEREPAENP